LGCTHYSLISDLIRQLVKPIRVVSQGEIVARKLTAYLKNHSEIKANLDLNSQIALTFTKKRFSLLDSGPIIFKGK
jgi:glutamate racemase